MSPTLRQVRTAIYNHAVAVEASLCRAGDAEHQQERVECLQRAERRAEAALAWAALLSAAHIHQPPPVTGAAIQKV